MNTIFSVLIEINIICCYNLKNSSHDLAVHMHFLITAVLAVHYTYCCKWLTKYFEAVIQFDGVFLCVVNTCDVGWCDTDALLYVKLHSKPNVLKTMCKGSVVLKALILLSWYKCKTYRHFIMAKKLFSDRENVCNRNGILVSHQDGCSWSYGLFGCSPSKQQAQRTASSLLSFLIGQYDWFGLCWKCLGAD